MGCSKRDGRKGRHDYRVKLPVSHEADVYIEELSDGTSSSQGYCKYSCRSWPYSRCQTEMRKSDGGGMRSKCISPYGGNKKYYRHNYPHCSEMPRHCERCDDFCAKKDGKRNRNSYKEKLKLPKEKKDVYVERIKKGYCKYNCRGWPYSNCLTEKRRNGLTQQ